MQYVVNSIINIDKEAEKYKNNIQEVVSSRKRELKTYLKSLEQEHEKDIENIRAALINNNIKRAEEKAQKIAEETESLIRELNNNYYSNKDDIISTIFKNIINS
ncbi:hypothetical protein [Clostridium polynesiense]|uniref:hypothetical protein n=1 Tax=Clostridium polynesiense TaxID=1325933 RepID=UPI0005913CA8|nr:hypothetical protein [Clostridium polynesiense]